MPHMLQRSKAEHNRTVQAWKTKPTCAERGQNAGDWPLCPCDLSLFEELDQVTLEPDASVLPATGLTATLTNHMQEKLSSASENLWGIGTVEHNSAARLLLNLCKTTRHTSVQQQHFCWLLSILSSITAASLA